MAETSYSCSVGQGFNFEKDRHDRVGHLNKLTIGDEVFDPVIELTDPENVAEGKVPVVGVISDIGWGGGYADPVYLTFQVNVPYKTRLATMVHKTLSKTDVEAEFTIYEYDPDAKKYFKCFHCEGTPVKGIIMKSGSELAFSVANDESSEILQPKNFTVSLSFVSQDIAQQLHLAMSETAKLAKQFGVAAGGA